MAKKKIEPFRMKEKLSSKQTKRLVELVLYEYQEIQREKRDFNAGLQDNHSVDVRIKEGKKAYNGEVDYTNFPYEDCANTAGIIIPAAVDAGRSQIMKAFNEDPPFKVMLEGDPDMIRQNEDFFQGVFRDKIPCAEQEISSWIDSGLLHGFGFLQNTWKKIMKNVRERITYKNIDEFLAVHDIEDLDEKKEKKLLSGKPVTLVEKYEIVEYSGQVLEWVDSADMLVRKDCRDINKEEFVGRIVRYTLAKLLSEDFDNIEDLVSDNEEKVAEVSSDNFTTIHAEVMFDKNLDGKKEKIFCVVEESKEVLLLCEKFPYEHGHSIYIPVFINPFRGNFWRMGFFDKLRSVHFTHKDIVDIILNSAYITIVPSFKAQKDTDFDPNEQEWYPGSITYLTDINSVVQWDIRPSQLPFSEWADKFQQYGYEMSGISPYNQGAPVSSGESGEKIKTLLAAGGIRMEEVIKNINYGLKELIWQSSELIKQMADNPGFIVEGQPVEIPESVFELNSSAYISSMDMNRLNPDAVLERDLFVLKTEMENPLVAQNPNAIREIHNKFLRSAGPGWSKLAEVILPSPEEIQQQQVATTKQALLEMAVEAEQGRNIPDGAPLP